MPSQWAMGGALAEGVLDTLESLPALVGRVDRSPLGSAAAIGVPLPLQRSVVARALGFNGLDLSGLGGGAGKNRGRGALLVHPAGTRCARLCQDVIVFTVRSSATSACGRPGYRLEHHAAQSATRICLS